MIHSHCLLFQSDGGEDSSGDDMEEDLAPQLLPASAAMDQGSSGDESASDAEDNDEEYETVTHLLN